MKINDFPNILPAVLTHSSNCDEMETVLFEVSSKFCHFRTNSRYGHGPGLQVVKPPQKRMARPGLQYNVSQFSLKLGQHFLVFGQYLH